MRSFAIFFVSLALFVVSAHSKTLTPNPSVTVQFKHTKNQFTLANRNIRLKIRFNNGAIAQETLEANRPSTNFFIGRTPVWKSDGGFAFDINWTGWRAPHKINNAENPVLLTNQDFVLKRFILNKMDKGGQQIDFILKGKETPFWVRLSYRLNPDQFWVQKQVSIQDSTFGYHFLRFIYPTYSRIKLLFKIIKRGGFGQPVVLRNRQTGFFSGLEYPAAINTISNGKDQATIIKCSLQVGQKIGVHFIQSPWQVLALAPPHYERLWFERYLKTQRVHPLKPYVLYNSWYDLRSPAFKDIPKQNIMNEANILRIIDLIEKNFVQKNGIHLDAFVLDDGWDVYASDWKLRSAQFPNGLKPIVERLQKLHTHLGLWLGPTGGYSFRMRRINWMASHGYEVIGKHSDRDHAMMCVAGRHYSQLLKKRTSDFVKKDSVTFFKWDGIQFSCSEPDHGHPVGLYSQRAIMDTVIALCQTVRKINPNVFLNITSGTWLSPWWVKYANQIWMQGGDYGYSNLPSISQRDAAITYRDNTLFRDFNIHHFWFPMANLMTHGIIKGQLQKLGGEQEPIDKFTDNALLYFARGVSMWELYISPDILSPKEWKAIAQSMKWARKNFNILKHTFMIGGNPSMGQTYAYVHFNGPHGIIAARNPFILSQSITVPLSDTLGLSSSATNLVLEQIYPYHWISPKLYSSGNRISLKIDGYETAIYRIFPLKEAKRPLPANIIFSGSWLTAHQYSVKAFVATGPLSMLNPAFSKSVYQRGKKAEHLNFKLPPADSINGLRSFSIKQDHSGLRFNLQLQPNTGAKIALLLQQDSPSVGQIPKLEIVYNGQKIKVQIQEQNPQWAWIKCPVNAPNSSWQVFLKRKNNSASWQGKISLWLLSDRQFPATDFVFETKRAGQAEILPPLPRSIGTLHHNQQLATFGIKNNQFAQKF